MRFTNQIETVNMDGLSDFERIDRNLRTLILSIEHMIPGSRGFGLSDAFIDYVAPDAVSQLAEELEERCEKYIPEISISGLDYEAGANGVVPVRIYVERRD